MKHDARLIRPATMADVPRLEALIVTSARALSRGFYTPDETEAAIEHVFGVDSQLIADGTYLVAQDDDATVLGCGGWSRRQTLFGGDRFAARDGGLVDPATGPARIRAFFVAPEAARHGIGAALLTAAEAAARDAGFRQMSLMATLPGVPFYQAHGYAAEPQILHPCGDVAVRFVPMAKSLLLQK